MIKKGDEVRIKPEWQDKGDKKFRWFAIEDEDGGRVRIRPDGTGLTFPPNQVVETTMLMPVEKPGADEKFARSFSRLLSQIPSNSPFEKDENGYPLNQWWTFTSMLEYLQERYLSAYESIDDSLQSIEIFEELFQMPGSDIKMQTIVDIFHDSDESCSIDVLSIKDKPTLMLHRVGDKSDYSDGLRILEPESARILLKGLLAMKAKNALAELEADHYKPSSIGDVLHAAGYLHVIGDEFFALASPKNAVGIRSAFDQHSAWHVENDGSVSHIQNFGSWVNGKQPWSGDADAHDANVTTESGPRVIDCRRLIFSVGPQPSSQERVREAAKSFTRLLETQDSVERIVSNRCTN